MKKLRKKLKNKLKFLLKKYIPKSFRYYYYNKIKKLILLSKWNYNFLRINDIYFYLKNCDLNHLNIILSIIKFFNIKIFENTPEKDEILIILKSKKIKNQKKLKQFNLSRLYLNKIKFFKSYSEKQIRLKYKIISNILNKLSSKFFNNFFILKLYFYKDKIRDYLFKISKKKELIRNNLFINEEDYAEKYHQNNSLLFNYYILFKKLFYKNYKFLKIKKYINFLKRINVFKEMFCNFDLFLINDLFYTFKNFNNKINLIKFKLYDISLNLSNIDFKKFTFYFIKHGSNINWLYNISNLSNFDENFIKIYKNFLSEQTKELKFIEKQLSISIKSFIKLFAFLERLKLKIDIIKEKILNKNLYLVNCVARKYFKKDLYIDCIQEGNVALIDAINKFNYKYIGFNNFALINIRRNINKFYFRNNKIIKLPTNLLIHFKKINRLTKLYFDKYNKIPDVLYISKKTRLPNEIVRKIFDYNKNYISLQSRVSENNSTKYIDLIKDENTFNLDNYIFNNQLKLYLTKILSKIKKSHFKIFCMRYGLINYKKFSITKISKKFNISIDRLNLIINSVLKFITKPQIKKDIINFVYYK